MRGIPELPAEVTDSLARAVAEVMPLVAGRVPREPGARLGRLGVSDLPVPASVVEALRALGPLLAGRLLGALELTLDDLDVDMPGGLREPAEPGTRMVAYAHFGEDDIVSPVSLLDQLRPGTTDLVHALAAGLAQRPTIQRLLAVDGADEPEIAARHGAAYLALAVGTAAIVLRARDVPRQRTSAVSIVGVGLGTAALLLADAPMPPAYAAALLARRRAEYVLPRRSAGGIAVRDHRFALAEGAVPEPADFSGNGLVAVVPGGAVIHTGTADGHVNVTLEVLAEPPDGVEVRGWDEVVEVSWTADNGGAAVIGAGQIGSREPLGPTPPWPGEYRLRVHASGRDDAGPDHYRLTVWSAPAAPEIVHKRTDRLGQRLRGEPVTPAPVVPEAAYRWIRDTPLSEAATITVVTGSTPEQVLRAFGADPSAPAGLTTLDQSSDIDPWVAVLKAGDGAVLAVESNGWQGAQCPVLRGLSRHGRAASMYWNVNALTRLSFAEAGEVCAAFEPGLEPAPDDPDVTAALAGLDFDDYRDKVEKGLVAVERFTGHPVRDADIDRIAATDVAYPIVPLLPDLYPEARLPDRSRAYPGSGPLGADTDELAFLPDERLRELAWWSAGQVVSHAGLAGHPAVAATLAARALSPEADILARTAQLGGHVEHHWLWMTLYRATNPDPLAAAIGALDAARYAVAGAAADLLDRARQQVR